jgi:hypothetical protein
MIYSFLPDNNDKNMNIIPENKKAHTKICGIFISDSTNIPAINEIQIKNNILDGLILLDNNIIIY